MENDFLTVISADTVIKTIAIAFLICLTIGITDFVQNLKKMGE